MVQPGVPEPTESNQPATESAHASHSDESWSALVRNAAFDFSRNVAESSQQLTAAAEKLAKDSISIFGDLGQKTEQASSKSTEMAAVATQAAAEARRLAEAIQSTIQQAVEGARAETKASLGEPARQAEQALQASELARLDLQKNLDDAVRRIEVSASAGREAANKAEQAAEESRQAAVEASAKAERAELATAEQGSGNWDQLRADLQSRIDQLTSKFDDSANATRETTARTETIANEARQTAAAAVAQAERNESATTTTVDPVANEVLERLEADYGLLTRLVQELHSRIATLSGQGPAPAADLRIAPAFESEPAPALETPGALAADRQPHAVAQEPTIETHRSWYPGGDHAASPPGESRDQQNESPAGEETPQTSSPTIAGHVLVSISPVSDFDRLLNLDGALGRMTGIENVTLADYAKEEVTFRVEIEPPTSIEDFRDRLSRSADTQVEVVSSGEGTVALGLVG